jgi:hypothetical protein
MKWIKSRKKEGVYPTKAVELLYNFLELSISAPKI